MKVLLATKRTCYETNVRHYSAVSDVCSASCLTERRGVQSAVYFTFPLCSIHTVPARSLINEAQLGSSGLPYVTLQPYCLHVDLGMLQVYGKRYGYPALVYGRGSG